MVIVGGSGYFFGPCLGALISVLLPEWLRALDSYYLIIYALLVMALLIYSPTGLIGAVEKRLASRRAKRASDARAQLSPTLDAR